MVISLVERIKFSVVGGKRRTKRGSQGTTFHVEKKQKKKSKTCTTVVRGMFDVQICNQVKSLLSVHTHAQLREKLSVMSNWIEGGRLRKGRKKKGNHEIKEG